VTHLSGKTYSEASASINMAGIVDAYRHDMPSLLVSADLRLRDWGQHQARGNSLRELGAKSCLRPRNLGGSFEAENPFADAVHVALRKHVSIEEFAALTGVYIRRMSQREVSAGLGMSKDRVYRIVHKAKLVVIAECF
jgi:hypothetical protein